MIIVCEVKLYFYLQFFSCLFLQCSEELLYIVNFFHYLFIDGEKLYQKTYNIQYDDKEIQHGLQLINNGASIDGLNLFWFRKLARMHVNLAGKKQGKQKPHQIKPSFSESESLGRVRILFKFRVKIRNNIWRSQLFQTLNFCEIQIYP